MKHASEAKMVSLLKDWLYVEEGIVCSLTRCAGAVLWILSNLQGLEVESFLRGAHSIQHNRKCYIRRIARDDVNTCRAPACCGTRSSRIDSRGLSDGD
jgi:hypothetical protein